MEDWVRKPTLNELSDLWDQRGVSDEEYVAALRQRVEELDRQLLEAHERILYLSGKLMEAERGSVS